MPVCWHQGQLGKDVIDTYSLKILASLGGRESTPSRTRPRQRNATHRTAAKGSATMAYKRQTLFHSLVCLYRHVRGQPGPSDVDHDQWISCGIQGCDPVLSAGCLTGNAPEAGVASLDI